MQNGPYTNPSNFTERRAVGPTRAAASDDPTTFNQESLAEGEEAVRRVSTTHCRLDLEHVKSSPLSLIDNHQSKLSRRLSTKSDLSQREFWSQSEPKAQPSVTTSKLSNLLRNCKGAEDPQTYEETHQPRNANPGIGSGKSLRSPIIMAPSPELSPKGKTTRSKTGNGNKRKASSQTPTSSPARKISKLDRTDDPAPGDKGQSDGKHSAQPGQTSPSSATGSASGAKAKAGPDLPAVASAAHTTATTTTTTKRRRARNSDAGDGPNLGPPGYDAARHETASQGLDRIIKEAVAAPRQPLPGVRAPLANGRHPLPTGRPTPAEKAKEGEKGGKDEGDEEQDEGEED